MKSFGALANRFNKAEAARLPEKEIEEAGAEIAEAVLKIEDLELLVTWTHAVSQNEVEGKKRALDVLTGNAAWERNSLFKLRRSIERDQQEVNARLVVGAHPAAQRLGWLSRFSLGSAKS
jgi:hypothetical protein